MGKFIKTIKVIDSCETVKQLRVARKFINLASKDMDLHTHMLLIHRYYDKLNMVKPTSP